MRKDSGSSVTHRCDVDESESKSRQTRDERDERLVPVTLFVADDPDDGADEAGGWPQSEGDQHQEEEDGKDLEPWSAHISWFKLLIGV